MTSKLSCIFRSNRIDLDSTVFYPICFQQESNVVPRSYFLFFQFWIRTMQGLREK